MLNLLFPLLLSLAAQPTSFPLAPKAPQQVGGPGAVVLVNGIVDGGVTPMPGMVPIGIIATARIGAQVVNDSVFWLAPLGRQDWEAALGTASHWSTFGRAEVHGNLRAESSGSPYNNLAHLYHHTKVTGQGPQTRTAAWGGGGNFTFSPAPGWGVWGYFRAEFSGIGETSGAGGAMAATATIVVPTNDRRTRTFTRTQANPAGFYAFTAPERLRVVGLPASVRVTGASTCTANGNAGARATVTAQARFIPTRIVNNATGEVFTF